MILFPAVDLKDGKAVRLKKGRADQVTVFSDDPVAMALRWESEGAKYLHLVDLDGAFKGTEASANAPIVRNICKAVHIPVQLGGGIRSAEIAKAWLDSGVTRLIIGTMALEAPDEFAALCKAFPHRIGVSLDAENGKLKTRGWVGDSGLTVDDVLPRLERDGAAFIIYTDISRDGMKAGANLPALEALAGKSSIPVIAAGGLSDMNDVKALYALSLRVNLEGAITGRAIYEGGLSVREAEAWLASQ